jgi:Bacterial SH3 domain
MAEDDPMKKNSNLRLANLAPERESNTPSIAHSLREASAQTTSQIAMDAQELQLSTSVSQPLNQITNEAEETTRGVNSSLATAMDHARSSAPGAGEHARPSEIAEMVRSMAKGPQLEISAMTESIARGAIQEFAEIAESITRGPHHEFAKMAERMAQGPTLKFAKLAEDMAHSPALKFARMAEDMAHSPALKFARMAEDMAHSPALKFARMAEDMAHSPALKFARIAEDMAHSPALKFARMAEDAVNGPILKFAKMAEAMTQGSTVNFAKMAEAMTRGPLRAFDEIAASYSAASRLDFAKLLEGVRASSQLGTLASELASYSAANGVLTLNTRLTESIRSVIETHLAEVGQTDDPGPENRAPAAQHAADIPEDFAWDAWLKRQPVYVQFLVMTLYLIVLLPCIEALWHAEVSKWIESRPEMRVQIVHDARESFGAEYVSGLRCTRGDGVNVRRSPSKSADVIGRLTRGQPVEVIETREGFSQIRYRDPTTGETRVGWAASGYLVKVAC